MAVPYLTSTTLIESIKRRASIPISQNTFTDEDLLAIANEEIFIGLVPSILQVHEEYFVTSENIDIVSNKANYPIPSRAIGNRLRQISYRDTSGNVYEMTRIQPELRYDDQHNQVTNAVYRFMVKNNEAVLIPSPSVQTVGGLEMSFFIRPNVMVTEDRVGIITDIDRNTGIVTLEDFPKAFAASNLYDFIRIPSPHRIITYDVAIVTLDPVTKTVTFDIADIPEDVNVGDSVMLAGETFVPNVPTDLHVVLAQRVATRCLEAMGDTQGLANANTKLQEMEFKTAEIIDNRVEGSPQKIVNRNNILRMGKIGRRWP